MSHPYIYLGLALALVMPLAQLTCVDTGTLVPDTRRGEGFTGTTTNIGSVPPTDLFETAQRQGTPITVPRKAQLQVALLWDSVANLDLLIFEPNGFRLGGAGARNAISPFTGGRVERFDDFFFGPEIIQYETVPAGSYQVFVEYVDVPEGEGPIPGDTTPFVNIKARDGYNAQVGGVGGTGTTGAAGATGTTGAAGATGAGGETGAIPVTNWDVRIIFNGKVYYFEGTLDGPGDRDHVATVNASGSEFKTQASVEVE